MSVHVRVRIAGEEYALPTSGVREVATFAGVTPIPGAPARILGAVNLRGQVVPVIDLAAALGLTAGDEPGRIVVAEAGGRQAGFAVEDVVDVGEVAESGEQPDAPLLSGTAMIDGDLVGIVDIDAVLAPEAIE